jgi:hypothetical protein
MILTIIIIYLSIILAVGFWANKYNKGMTDFILAGRRLGLGLATFTIAATYFGGGYVLGLAEAAYQNGIVAWWFGIGGGVGLILTGFLAGKVRAMNIYTIPDFFGAQIWRQAFQAINSCYHCNYIHRNSGIPDTGDQSRTVHSRTGNNEGSGCSCHCFYHLFSCWGALGCNHY